MREQIEKPTLEEWIGRVKTQNVPPRRTDRDGRPSKESPFKRIELTSRPAHAGLWLDRCLLEGDDKHEGREFLHLVAVDALRIGKRDEEDAPAIKEYRPIYARWEQTVQQSVPGVVRRVYRMRAASRILLHPATKETVTEGGLLLHHTYGVPYIPGSALKGAARAWAVGRGIEDPPPGIPARIEEMTWMDHLFGLERDADKEWLETRKKEKKPDDRPDTAGIFDFYDALLVPEVPEKVREHFSPLAIDVVNPHQGSYYTTKNNRPAPSETSEPEPSFLLTVAPGTTFLLVVETREAMGTIFTQWLDWMIADLLDPALREMGIGARTSSGYGRLEILGLARRTEVEVGPSVGLGWVTYVKGEVKLRAFFREEKTYAEVRGPVVKDIMAGLSEGTLTRLHKGKEVRLHVFWEAVGNARRIVRLGEG